MTLVDLPDVRTFTNALNAQMDRCDHGEGNECATLDDALRHYANLCCEFRDAVRGWGQAVFSGQAAFDPEVEQVWLQEGKLLSARAHEVLSYARRAETACYILDGRDALQSALWDLSQLLRNWVTPKLAVGPAARHGAGRMPETTIGEVMQLLESLPLLPEEWQPIDRKQQQQLQRIRRKKAD